MKRLLTGLAAASLLIGVPLAAAANDRDDHRRGWERHGHHGDHGHWNSRGVYYHRPGAARRTAGAADLSTGGVRAAPVVAYQHPPVGGPRVSIGSASSSDRTEVPLLGGGFRVERSVWLASSAIHISARIAPLQSAARLPARWVRSSVSVPLLLCWRARVLRHAITPRSRSSGPAGGHSAHDHHGDSGDDVIAPIRSYCRSPKRRRRVPVSTTVESSAAVSPLSFSTTSRKRRRWQPSPVLDRTGS
jgi:hypothetical protein